MDLGMQADGLDDLEADGMDRGEGTHGLLENEPDTPPTDAPHRVPAGVQGGDVDDAVIVREQDGAASNAAWLVDNAQQRARGNTLAGAALADEAQGRTT